jgi:hypothetical protein
MPKIVAPTVFRRYQMCTRAHDSPQACNSLNAEFELIMKHLRPLIHLLLFERKPDRPETWQLLIQPATRKLPAASE